MKKIFTILILINVTICFAQGSSIIFDITPYNVRSFHTFKIDGIGKKLIYMQQGMLQSGPAVIGGNVYLLQNDRVTWTEANFLNAQCCAVQNTCYPIE